MTDFQNPHRSGPGEALPEEALRAAIAGAGLTPPDHIEADGTLHRFSSNGKRGDKSGYYVLHGDGIPAGVFGCWRAGLTQTWCSKPDNDLTEAERQAMRERVRQAQAARDAAVARARLNAQTTAIQRWQSAQPYPAGHPYLLAKGIQPHGLRMNAAGALLVPLRDENGTLCSLQTIAPDGGKRFLTGGKVAGCYCAIGQIGPLLIVCEGFATGASIHEATGYPVACAMNAGNLQAVAQALHRRHPGTLVVVAADDDWRTEGNPGLSAAQQAALSVGGLMVKPHFPPHRPPKATDFNDLHQWAGHAAVRACFAFLEDFPC